MKRLTFMIIIFGEILTYASNGGMLVKIGENLQTKQVIQARETSFPYFIQLNSFNTNKTKAIVTLAMPNESLWAPNKQKMYTAILDLQTKKIIHIEPKVPCDIHLVDEWMVKRYANEMVVTNINTGITLKDNLQIMEIIDAQLMGLAYRNSINEHELIGFDIVNGEIKWERKVEKSLGWQQTIAPTDSTILILANNLHYINLRTGEGWDFEVNSETDITEYIFEYTQPGAMSWSLSGTMEEHSETSPTKYGNSNLLYHKGRVYIANRKGLTCINLHGKVLWQQQLSVQATTSSKILLHHNRVIMINEGVMLQGKYLRKVGIPYLASFHARNGKRIYHNRLGKSAKLISYNLDKERINLQFNKRILSYSLKSGQLIDETPIDNMFNGSVLMSNDYYAEINPGNYLPLVEIDKSHYYLKNGQEVYLVHRQTGKISSKHNINGFFRHIGIINDAKLFEKEGFTYLLETKSESMIKLFNGNTLFHNQSALIGYQDNKLIEIAFDQLFPIE